MKKMNKYKEIHNEYDMSQRNIDYMSVCCDTDKIGKCMKYALNRLNEMRNKLNMIESEKSNNEYEK